jgi:predicted transcriptional regulator of viral defense system
MHRASPAFTPCQRDPHPPHWDRNPANNGGKFTHVVPVREASHPLGRMSSYRSGLSELFATQQGVVSRRQMREVGCGERTCERLLGRGEIYRVLPGVYRSATWPFGREQLKVAACLRNPLAALAFTTAGQEWGLRRMTDPRIHVLVPHGVSPELDRVIVHRCRRIDAVDLVERPGGVRVTSVARTLFDVGAVVGTARLRSAVENAIDKKLVTFDSIADAVQRLYHRRRPGSLQIRSVMNSRSDWSAAVQSELELRMLTVLRRAGLPTPEVQHVITFSDGSSARFDFAWPELLVALEVDHSFWHSGSLESSKDKGRDRKAAGLGWITLRVTDDDMRSDVHGAIREIAAVIDERRARMGK